ncbi:MAG: TonB family protein / TonB-dependent receptor [Myxococcales bacterium]|nr:TonB family protein / TonB-dependent receptor [Myxococcales bacterium]
MNWKIRIAFHLALTVGVAVTAIARSAHGADGAPALTAPKLLTFVPATDPESAGTPPRTAPVDVDVELTIDAAGKVTEARVPTLVGRGFDEAAIAACKQFVFEPARRDGQAIPSRIKYRYVFDPPPPPPPTTGALEGKVLTRATGAPNAGAVVALVSADGVRRDVVTDAAGAFRVTDLPPGAYHVSIAAAGLAPLAVSEDVAVGELTSVTYRLDVPAAKTDGETLEFGATATIEAPPREVTKRSLDAGELLRAAGTRGDPLRAIEYMPGVGRSPVANFVIIRGSSPADSEVQFEGAPVQRLYHFGGLTSFVQPRLLDKIDLYPGNFSARFGRKMGGIIDVGVRDPKTDGFHGMLDINIVDSSFLLEGPLSKNWSFAVAAKRSYIDFFFDKLVPKEDLTVLAAPVYWDYQAMVVYKPSDADRFRAMVYGSYDDFKLILANPIDNDPEIRGQLSSYSGFHRGTFLWQHKYSAAVEHEINLSAGPYAFGQKAGPDLTLDVPGWDAYLRAEWRVRASDSLRLIGGLDLANTSLDGKYNGPAISQLDGDPQGVNDSVTGKSNVYVARTINFFHPAAYAEAIWQPVARLSIVPGARVDYVRELDRWAFDPRITGRYELSPTTTLKGGVGLFSQIPDFAEEIPVIGNPHLRLPHAIHYSAGVEQLVGARLKLTLEGFYKQLALLTVNSPVPGENLNNDGIGRIYGAEASARLRPTTKSSGFLSYTLSRSERRDHAGDAWRLFNWDQTNILTVAGAYRLGGHWDVSSTFRYVTGNPYTPVNASVYNANTDTYKPVYGATNSSRDPAFHRLDLRVERTWLIKRVSLAAYLDVQNAYNRQSQEGRTYNFDFTQSKGIPGLPIIPSIGLRGEI